MATTRKIQEESAALHSRQEGASLWTRAREFVPPVLDFVVLKTTTGEPILPTAYVFPPDDPAVGEKANNLSFFRLLERSSSLVDQLKVLRDLIEVRTCLVTDGPVALC